MYALYRLLGTIGALVAACAITAIGWAIDYAFDWHVNSKVASAEYGAICFIIGLLVVVVVGSVGTVLLMIVAASIESIRDAWSAARERNLAVVGDNEVL